ncbi:MAG: DUF4258 domain-containing protein [Candidatus Hydrogenedentes bacterium]|nr:DUF4258 domain-containing protein [Candidatus Hydrogenedentota bacterium]
MNLGDIVDAIRANRIRITNHADEEAQLDGLALADISLSVLRGEIIEKYADDKPYPSCLIFGHSANNEPIHSVWAYNAETRFAVLVTVYRPDPERWIDWRSRRKR